MVWSFAGAGAAGNSGSSGEMLELTLIDLQKQIDELRALLGQIDDIRSHQSTQDADITALKAKSHTHSAS